MALAVALAMNDAPFDSNAFFQTLISCAATEEFRAQLERAAALQANDGVGCLGNNLAAHQSVVTAIAAFALSGEDYTRSIASAIALGGDVDTLAAMAGALAGARLGIGAVPSHLLDRLENGPRGREFLFSLANELYRKFEGSQKSQ
jgi:poly(ADP-ribose) glycohydrolase ARH3